MNKDIINPVVTDARISSSFEPPRAPFDSLIGSFIRETQKYGGESMFKSNSFHCLVSKCGNYLYFGEIYYSSLDDPSLVKHGTGILMPFGQHDKIKVGLWYHDELVEEHISIDDTFLERLKVRWDSVRRPLYLEYTAGITLTPPPLARRKTGVHLYCGDTFSPPKCHKRKRSQFLEVYISKFSFLTFIVLKFLKI